MSKVGKVSEKSALMWVPGMWVGASFTALQFLVVVGCVGLVPFPQFLGEVLSVFL